MNDEQGGRSTETVTRAHLKAACDAGDWDLLDRLLEIDASEINDRSLYTDTWGIWWGLLFETARRGAVDGVRVLLKHGANREFGCWGDGEEVSIAEVASENAAILALLSSQRPPTYVRRTDPSIPALTEDDRAINRQGEIRDRTGLLFQIPPKQD